MSSKIKYFVSAIYIIGSLICTWYLFANLQPLKPSLYAFVVCVLIGIYISIKVFRNDLLIFARKKVISLSKKKHFVFIVISILILVGLLARLFFYIRFSYSPVSDPVTFFDAAKTLAETGNLREGPYSSYVAFQPYLSAYNNTLALSMKLISNPWLATILLNTFIDILSSLAIYVLLKKILKPSSLVPLAAFAVWMLSPMNIIFSVISLPIIIVNFFVISTILVTYLLISQISNQKIKPTIITAMVLGLILGMGNMFRPIFTVPIIALAIVLFFMFLVNNRSAGFIKLSVLSVLLLSTIFAVIQIINVSFVTNQTGLPAAKNPSGWSMYVGSTWDTNGEWRPYHSIERRNICESSLAENDFDECHDELRSVAIDHYQYYGISNSISLFIQKLYHQAEEQSYFYNAEHSIVGYTESKTFKIMNIYTTLFILALYISSAISLYRFAKRSSASSWLDPVLLFATLVMIGWFFSFILVESAPRYSTILYPIFIIFSMLFFYKPRRN